MVTGWKRWRPAVSFLAFFLGLSLLFCGLLPLAAAVAVGGGTGEIRDSFMENYQDTERFKTYLLDSLRNFLTIAEGGSLDQYENAYFPTAPADAGLTEKVLSLYESDKNLLYWIRCKNGEVYTNHMEYPIGDGDQPLPEGYNFLLTYEYGGNITVFQNGRFHDEPYFQDAGLFSAENRKIDLENPDEYCEIRIVLAAAANPRNDMQTERGGGYNTLYQLTEELRRARWTYVQYMVNLAAGLILLVPAFFLRKWKRRADRYLARLTGRIWLELKAGAITVLILLLSGPLIGDFFAILNPGDGYRYIDLSKIPRIFRTLGEHLFLFLALFWAIYLLANDLRYHRGYFRSLWPLVKARAEAAKNRYPFEKRMDRRRRGILICAAILALMAALPILYEFEWYADYGSDRIAGIVLQLCFILGTFAIFCWLLMRNVVLTRDMGRLIDQIEAIRDGDFTPLELEGDLAEAARALNGVEEGLSAALEERIKSERMKVELITNVSHDVKTPLTSIIGYVELLKQEDLPEAARDYVRILDEKSRRLRTMVQDVFEVSKAASGQLPVKRETLDFGKLLRQTLADMAETVEKAPVTVRADIPDAPVPVAADGQRMYRVFQNLIQNALQYSLEGSRVYVALALAEGRALATVKNTSKTELTDMDYTERFVRGDASRTDGGSGLGLSIARSFTEACGGSFRVETDADLFTASVAFPLAEDVPAQEADMIEEEGK